MKILKKIITVLAISHFLSYAGISGATDQDHVGSLKKINTIVVIYAENRSFDNLYGLFPGADGIFKNADGTPTDLKIFQQLDRDGVTPLPRLPTVWNAKDQAAEKLSFVAELPNAPFRIDAPPGGLPGEMSQNIVTPDLSHRFYGNQMQINAGKNNLFAAWTNAGGLTMGYYDGASMQLWQLAQRYTLADHFFMGAFGGSFLNHFWLVCACTPIFPNAEPKLISRVDSSGVKLSLAESSPDSALDGKPVFEADKSVSPDGYAINTAQPPYQPSKISPATNDLRCPKKAETMLPAQDSSKIKTIGDTLSAKAVNWAWYAGAWNEALSNPCIMDNPGTANFQTHHQPFNYFSRFDPATEKGAAERKAHLKDYQELLVDIANGTLPPVVFYKPQGSLNQHPGYTDVLSGDAHIAELVTRLENSKQWPNMAVIVTYDENGGYWDHIAPPKGDRWGPGTRIPTIIISPFAKRNHVDHSYYDTTSIIKLITQRFALEPLPGVRPNAGNLMNAFEF